MTGSSSRLRILLVGAGGTLGRAVAQELGARHEVLAAGRTHGDVRLDLADPRSIVAALERSRPLDAVACAAGNVAFAPLDAICPAALADSVFRLGLEDKLMGQVNLALAARAALRDGGSITLIGGILSREPIVSGACASLVNGGLESFVRAAAIEMVRGLRINLVSPTLFEESVPTYGPLFRGFEAVPVSRVALAYARSIEGRQTGQIYRVASRP